MIKKLGLLLVSVALLVLLFTLIGGTNNDGTVPALAQRGNNPASARKNSIVVTTLPYSGNFNPLYLETEADNAITRLLFDPLVEPDETGAPVAVLADYTISVDGRSYTFAIKPSATFSNGDAVTAEDIAFTLHVLCDPSYKGHLNAASLGIEGYEAYHSGAAESLAGVEVVDSSTLRVTLREANSAALFVLGVSPLSKTYYGVDYAKGRLDNVLLQLSRPMGCGQYSLTTLTMEQLTLDRCKSYYRGAPTVEQVQFVVKTAAESTAMLLDGSADLDLTGASAGMSIAGQEHLIEQNYLGDSYGLLGFSGSSRILSDPAVRRAVALCIDRQTLIDQTFAAGGASPLVLPVSLDSWANPDTMPEPQFDTAAAAALLEQAGYVKNADGIYAKDKVTLNLTYYITENNTASANLAAMLQQNLPKVGMGITVRSLDYSSLINLVKLGRCELWFMGWKAPADPDLTDQISGDGIYNLYGYRSDRADSLLSQALAESELERRQSVYGLLWQELETNPPFVSLYQRNERAVFNIRLQALSFNTQRPVTADFYLVRF